jgi:hypothetical protein
MKHKEIYFPMTCNLLTVGHIKCIEYLAERGFVTVGLLTSKALKGYKKEIMPFEERKYILDTIAAAISDMRVIPQNSLNPASNLRGYGYTHLASGDGFERVELNAIKRFGLKKLDIKLKGEKTKKWSSSKLLAKS